VPLTDRPGGLVIAPEATSLINRIEQAPGHRLHLRSGRLASPRHRIAVSAVTIVTSLWPPLLQGAAESTAQQPDRL
jgi:hypothetical protein